MTISAKIIADSVAFEGGPRITTMQLRYPRFIHAEFMTHRMFSRNASSSRAIPVAKLIEDIKRDPVMPIYWGKNQPGMQAKEEHRQEVITGFGSDDYTFGPPEEAWRLARDDAIRRAQCFADAGYHKQIVNRLLEPFSHINVVMTTTEWDNYFLLRCHEDAQPEIQELARQMLDLLMHNDPVTSNEHLPYVLPEEVSVRPIYELVNLSAARCARTSYLTHEGKAPDFESDMLLAGKLLKPPIHFSPFEHPARAGVPFMRYANFTGWESTRWSMENAQIEGSRAT